MTKSYLSLAALCAVLSATAVSAQSVPFSEIDSDEDGVLSYTELTTTFGEDGAATVLATADSDGDDSVTEDELRGGGDARREAGEGDERGHRGHADDSDDSDDEESASDDDDESEDRPRPPRGKRGGKGPQENSDDSGSATE